MYNIGNKVSERSPIMRTDFNQVLSELYHLVQSLVE